MSFLNNKITKEQEYSSSDIFFVQCVMCSRVVSSQDEGAVTTDRDPFIGNLMEVPVIQKGYCSKKCKQLKDLKE